ncbi:hypothetical protein LTR91_026894, partial [Friedmanniomyces endolithicus]
LHLGENNWAADRARIAKADILTSNFDARQDRTLPKSDSKAPTWGAWRDVMRQ